MNIKSTINQCNTTNTNVVQQKENLNHTHMINVRVNDRLYNALQELKDRKHAKKESEILRAVLRIGIIGANWLEKRGELLLSDYKIMKVLSELSLDEKAELYEILKHELGV